MQEIIKKDGLHTLTRNFLLLIVCMFACAQSSFATTAIVPLDDDLIIGARAIIRGKVLSVSSALDNTDNRIYTYVTLRVQEVLKGHLLERKIVLKELGGVVGDKGFTVFGNAQFTVDERVVVYLDTWADGSLRAHQMFLGKFSIIREAGTNRFIAVRTSPDSNTTILNNLSGHQHSGGVITNQMEVGAYTEMVRRRLEANQSRAEEFEATHYSSVPMLAAPPEHKLLERRGGLQPQFTLITNATPPRWFEPDSGEPVVFFVNPEGAPYPQVFEDVNVALSVWSSVPGCSLRVTNGGTLNGCYTGSGINGIVFDNCDGRNAPTPGCSGVLAWGGCGWSGNVTRVVNGTTFFKAREGFVSFNPYASCNFNDRCNVQEITTHEIGHALGLGHSQVPDAAMWGIAHFDNRCATLHQDDINGITFIYPITGGGSGPLAILTQSPLTGGRIGASYLQTLIGTGGATPYTWSLASGALPPGLALAQSGAIAGTPTSAGTFNFTIQLRDAQAATAQRAFSIIVTAASTQYDSQFVSQNVPTTLEPGQLFYATIKWMNTGTLPWSGSAGFQVQSQNPASNATWGGNTIPVFTTIAPGQQFDLTFSVFAPRSPGTYNFQWQLYQSGVGVFGQMSANVSVNIPQGNTPVIGGPDAVESVRGATFSHQLTAAGGATPYTWSIITGALPAGINLNSSTGLLSGAATSTGVFSIIAQVTDAERRTGQKALTITIAAPPIEVMTSSLPAAVKGSIYGQQLAVMGGAAPFTWRVSSGALPGGLGLNATSGIITGTATSAGSFHFTVEVTDSAARAARRALSIIVAPPPLRVETGASTETIKGSSFIYTFGATGGTAPYTWSIASGALPNGFTLNQGTGAISGAATTSGTFNVVIAVRDQNSLSESGSLQIKVIDPNSLPSITQVKYKASKKRLTVYGTRIDSTATLLIDAMAQAVGFSDGKFYMKKLTLARGTHEIRVINSNGVTSQPFTLNVN